jgi:transposase-like protein
MEPRVSASLSPVQAQVALSLASGASITQAALAAGVGRTTIYEWRKNIPEFSAAVEQAAYDYTESVRDQLRTVSAKALTTLEQILDDPAASPSVRLRAALAVLNRPRFPKGDWALPGRACTPEDLEEAEEESIDDFRTFPNTSEQESDFSTPVPTRHVDKVGRNEPCPCGSGQKYKKCCLNLSAAGKAA